MNGFWRLRSSKGEGRYELPTGDVEWPHPTTGRHGAATFTIPKDHAAEALVEQRMWATYEDQTLGTWPGRVVVPPQWTTAGVDVSVLHVSHTFLRRRCYSQQKLVGLTPGGVVRAAFLAAFGDGVDGHILLGTVLEAPPVVMEYELTGQAFDAVLSDMEEASGQTWTFEGDTFNWVANTDTLYDLVLVQDGDFFMPSRGPVERGDRVGQIIAKDKAGHTALSPAVPPSVTDDQDEITVETTSQSELQEAADMEVARRAKPSTIFTFILKDAPYGASDDPADRSAVSGRIPMLMINKNAVSAFEHRRRIREGSVIRFVAPRSRTGDGGLGRVISRTLMGDTGLIQVEVEYLWPFDAVTAQAAGRGVSRGPLQRPPTLPGQPEPEGETGAEIMARLIKGKVAQAQTADSAVTAALATALASLAGLPAGAFPAGNTIAGSQVTSAVANATSATTATTATTATNLASLAGLPAGALPAGITLAATQLAAGAVPAGVTLNAGQLSGGTVPTAVMPTGGAVTTPASNTAAATFGATEQTMLQEAHDAVRLLLGVVKAKVFPT